VSLVQDLTIREAGALLRSGALSAEELTEGILARIAATEPVVHAYVQVFGDEALAAARAVDVELRAGRDRGPLHGIPIAIKDFFDVAGTVTGCGSRVRDDAPAAESDAEAIARLRDAGALVVGKTVTHEFAAGVLSPPARNPWDPSRIPGGSSGGSAAAVGAGSCLGALSSDTAGSIRVPAALTGVVGIKPTRGRVSTRGAFPLAWSVDTVGTHAKTVDDAMLLLAALADNDPSLDGTPLRVPDSAPTETLRGVRLGVPRPYFFDHLLADVDAAVAAAVALLADLGAEVVEVPWPEAQTAAAAGLIVIRSEMAAVHAEALRAVPERYGPVLRARLEGFSLYPARGYLRARQARTAARRAMAELFATHQLDALVVPTTEATATPADEPTSSSPSEEDSFHGGFFRLTVPFNATGQPALAVPCGFDGAGLPIGLQLVGAPWAETGLARIGQAYGRAAGWSTRRPTL
jgi:aspartyl-tRNA(Asn)/glutamyl-tRNA(Gln) amidotransferase subunit A